MEDIKKQEDRIQQEMVVWYNNTFCKTTDDHRCMIFHVPNQNQYQLIGIGVLAGVSDLIVIHRPSLQHIGTHLYIEVKTPKGTQSPKQVEFQHRIESLGYTYHLVRTLEQFKDYIINFHNDQRSSAGINAQLII